jgi:hypothetical protein
MITAKEAKEIYDKSGIEVEVANYMKLTVEQAVKSAAEGGKRSTIVYLGAATCHGLPSCRATARRSGPPSRPYRRYT